MDAKRIGTGEMVAGGGGLVLLLALFLDWIGSASAWQLFRLVDIILFVIAVGVVAVVAARAAGVDLPAAAFLTSIVLAAGLVALVVSLAFLLEGSSLGIGIFLAVLASAAIAYGGLSSGGAGPLSLDEGSTGAEASGQSSAQGRGSAASRRPPQ